MKWHMFGRSFGKDDHNPDSIYEENGRIKEEFVEKLSDPNYRDEHTDKDIEAFYKGDNFGEKNLSKFLLKQRLRRAVYEERDKGTPAVQEYGRQMKEELERRRVNRQADMRQMGFQDNNDGTWSDPDGFLYDSDGDPIG